MPSSQPGALPQAVIRRPFGPKASASAKATAKMQGSLHCAFANSANAPVEMTTLYQQGIALVTRQLFQGTSQCCIKAGQITRADPVPQAGVQRLPNLSRLHQDSLALAR
jgi:hypothetical protein